LSKDQVNRALLEKIRIGRKVASFGRICRRECTRKLGKVFENGWDRIALTPFLTPLRRVGPTGITRKEKKQL